MLSFEPVNLDAQREYLNIFDKTPEKTSDYSFMNLWGWAEAYALEWAFDRDLVWIRQLEPEKKYWAPVGDWNAQDWPKLMTAHFDKKTVFHRVPDKLTSLWEQSLGDRFEKASDRDNWDYLYNVQELIDLAGRKYHTKRNHFNQFTKRYSFCYKPMTAARADMALALQDDWCFWRDCESDFTLNAENGAVFRTFTAWDKLESAMGGVLYVDGDVVAYTVGEALTPQMMLIHFEKGCPTIRGAYQAINQMFLENTARDHLLVNRESDLGDEGLKKAKLSYHPTGYMKKSIVAISPDSP